MITKFRLLGATAAVAVLGIVAVSSAAVTFDPAAGTGFVGKGDVQLLYGWNNKGLQDNAKLVDFRVQSTEVTEQSWECTNSNNNKVQERERTTTTSIQGLVTTITRDKNQVTGFNLGGYEAGSTQSSTSDGPAVNSCPNAQGTWSLTTPAGAPVVVSSSGGGLEVSIDNTAWYAIG